MDWNNETFTDDSRFQVIRFAVGIYLSFMVFNSARDKRIDDTYAVAYAHRQYALIRSRAPALPPIHSLNAALQDADLPALNYSSDPFVCSCQDFHPQAETVSSTPFGRPLPPAGLGFSSVWLKLILLIKEMILMGRELL